MNKQVLNDFLELPQPPEMTQIEYVWVGGFGDDMRSKTKTLNKVPKTVEEVPNWSVGDFCEGMRTHEIVEFTLKPIRMYNDPFRKGNNKIVLCEMYDPRDGSPFIKNFRKSCSEALALVEKDHEPWFGFEQEYIILDKLTRRPYLWPPHGFPPPQGPHLYGVDNYGREVAEAHYRACIFAGCQIFGINAEIVPAQWEYQLGPSPGLKLADDLWMSRYILYRVAELFGVSVSFDPKPIPGADWNGQGGHFSVSTKTTRTAPQGLDNILKLIDNLKITHLEDLKQYDAHGGEDNKRRLDGSNPTLSKLEEFTSGIGTREVSVRVPQPSADAKCGYFEDRRPASNCDPYLVINRLIRSMYKLGY